MGLFVPTAGSTIAGGSEVSVEGAEKAAVWFSITANDDGFGASAEIFDDTGCTIADRQILRLATSACTMSPLIGPFISTCGIYIAGIDGGSVNIWVRPTSR